MAKHHKKAKAEPIKPVVEEKEKFLSKNWLKFSIALIAIIIIAATIYIVLNPGKTEKPAGEVSVLATVNGEKITSAELDAELEKLPPAYAQMKDNEQLRQSILQQLIVKELMFEEIKKKGITVSEDEISAGIKKDMEAAGITQDKLDDALSQQGLTMDAFKEVYKEKLVIEKLLEQELNIKVEDAEVKEYYDKNKDELVQLKASHILVCYTGTSMCQKTRTEQEAKNIINEIKQKIAKGEDFAKLALAYSDDPSASMLNGSLGWFGKGKMVKEFEEAAFKLKAGEVSDAVKTDFGYHLIKLDAKKSTFDELKEEIQTQLKSQKQQEQITIYLDKLKANAKIEMAK